MLSVAAEGSRTEVSLDLAVFFLVAFFCGQEMRNVVWPRMTSTPADVIPSKG